MDGGDHFEAFVRRFQDMVYAVALRLLGEPADAEDVAQSVFLLAYRNFGMLGENPAAPGWLKTMATNLSLNHLTRHRARWQLFSEMERDDDGGGEGGIPGVLLQGMDGKNEFVGEGDEEGSGDRVEAIEAALQSLPDHQRVPLVLYHFEEKSYQEIATVLGISLGKVKTDIHRGRETIKRGLGLERRAEPVRRG
jgi:RNA polymerase sigma-70 factor (ECF subfamily)